MTVTAKTFQDDRHGRLYNNVVSEEAIASPLVFDIVNDPENGQRMVHASELGLPALRGIVRFLEADEQIVAALSVLRFRQMVGKAIMFRMAELGWVTTGEKKPVPDSQFFTIAERYVQAGG